MDSQCAAQAIETLTRFSDIDEESLSLAVRVAEWSIRNMQDVDGHFYYRMYPLITSRTAMLHWSQATHYRALALLWSRLSARHE